MHKYKPSASATHSLPSHISNTLVLYIYVPVLYILSFIYSIYILHSLLSDLTISLSFPLVPHRRICCAASYTIYIYVFYYCGRLCYIYRRFLFSFTAYLDSMRVRAPCSFCGAAMLFSLSLLLLCVSLIRRYIFLFLSYTIHARLCSISPARILTCCALQYREFYFLCFKLMTLFSIFSFFIIS